MPETTQCYIVLYIGAKTPCTFALEILPATQASCHEEETRLNVTPPDSIVVEYL